MPFWPFFCVTAFMNFVVLLMITSIVGNVWVDASAKFWGSLIMSLVFDLVLVVSWLFMNGLLS